MVSTEQQIPQLSNYHRNGLSDLSYIKIFSSDISSEAMEQFFKKTFLYDDLAKIVKLFVITFFFTNCPK